MRVVARRSDVRRGHAPAVLHTSSCVESLCMYLSFVLNYSQVCNLHYERFPLLSIHNPPGPPSTSKLDLDTFRHPDGSTALFVYCEL